MAETAGWRAKKGRREEELRNSQEKRRTRLHSDKHVCPRRRNPTALKTILSSRQTERDGKAECPAEQSDGHPARCWGSRVASEPRLSTRGESGHVARGKESPPLCLAKLRREVACSPRCVGVARAACRRAGALCGSNRERRSGAGPTGRGWSNTLTCLGFFVALPSHWQWWRKGQGRQLRMLAAYTTRRLPSASLRCSCATSA